MIDYAGLESQSPRRIIEQIKDGSIAYEDLEKDRQVDIYEHLLISEQELPELVLLKVSQAREHDFTNIRGDENCSMDRNVYKVRPGNYVVVTYERSSGGMSRAQAGFVSGVIEDSLVDPAITIAQLPDVLEGVDTRGKSREELKELLLKHILEGGRIEDVGIDNKHRLIEEMRGQGYYLVTVVGEVKEPPNYANDGGLIIKGGEGGKDLDIDMSNVRELHVVGINVPEVKGVDSKNN